MGPHQPPAFDEELDRLYGLPREEFVAARDALAKRLRADGDREAAEGVRRLAKPTLAAWAVNQLSRREPGGLRALLAAGEDLRQAQERLGEGRADADDLRAASGAHRQAERSLVAAAGTILRESGASAGVATLQRVRETLSAAASDEETRALVAAGRLSREREPVGFPGLAPAPAGPEPEPGREGDREGAEDGDRARERAEKDASRRREEEAEARRRAEDAARRRREEEARRRAEEDEARRRAEREAARRAAEEARRRAREADRALEDAIREEERAQTALERAGRARARAQEDRDAARAAADEAEARARDAGAP